jgi:hypothetical protein
MVRSNRPCHRLYYLPTQLLSIDTFYNFITMSTSTSAPDRGIAQLTGKSVLRTPVHDEVVMKGCAESIKARAAVIERAPLPASVEKNKLPGEAVRESGAMWGCCASVLPRKKPDTGCIQRGDKHHFRGDRFDLPSIPLGGRLPSDRSGLRRTGGERRNPADSNGKARQMRPGQLIAEILRRYQLRASHPMERKAFGAYPISRYPKRSGNANLSKC